MHKTAFQNCKRFVENYLSTQDKLRILDVGSYDVNGTVRPIFNTPNWSYVGMDMHGSKEKNVDINLLDPHHFPFSSNTFDVVVSSSCLEHDPTFWITFQEMVRITKHDGWIYLNVPSTGHYHGYPVDCWRFLKDAYSGLAKWTGITLVEQYIDERDQWKDNIGIFKVTKTIDQRGFWKGTEVAETEHCYDPDLSLAITNWFQKQKASSVADFGCGTGAYTKRLVASGISCEGFDGNPQTPEISEGIGIVLDLSQPFALGKQFDWVLCLEVGEHIPEEYEETLLTNIHRHNNEGVVLSWGVEGQNGFGHVNLRSNAYIKEKFESMGYCNDILAERTFRDESSLPWFKNTIMVFRKISNMTLYQRLLVAYNNHKHRY